LGRDFLYARINESAVSLIVLASTMSVAFDFVFTITVFAALGIFTAALL
jgi:hypothetical protein